MGQSPSTWCPTSPPSPYWALQNPTAFTSDSDDAVSVSDHTLVLPDECLALIFNSLSAVDRKRSSLVCCRWLIIEGQSRHRLTLNAQSRLADFVPILFSRFDSVTMLTLKCDRRSASVSDDALVLISLRCRNLVALKLRACRKLTDDGIAAFAENCKDLRKFSCGSCSFGVSGVNALLENCQFLEELSVKRLRGITNGASSHPIRPGKAASALKMICLKDLYYAQCFGQLMAAAKNLAILKLFNCSGDWDELLGVIADGIHGLVEVHFERIQVSDLGLSAISSSANLEILHLVKTAKCTNVGLMAVAEKCKLLRKLRIDGWKTDRISDCGLIAVAVNCPNLQELVLIGVNTTHLSLDKLANNCPNLERLALCGSETIGDAEMSCIAAKCVALKKLCIKSCPVSDHGMEALAGGCPNLVKVKFRKCRGVTSDGANWLRARRGSLVVNLDVIEPQLPNAFVQGDVGDDNDVDIASSSIGRSTSFKMRFGSLRERSLVACSFRRWPSFGGRFQNNLRRN